MMLTKLGIALVGGWLGLSAIVAQILEPDAINEPGFWVQQGATIPTLWIVLYYFWRLFNDSKQTYETRLERNTERYEKDKEHYRQVIRDWEAKYDVLRKEKDEEIRQLRNGTRPKK